MRRFLIKNIKQMNEKFNHEDSLSLISEMIERTRNNIREKGSSSMIYWGYVVATLSIINHVLMKTLDDFDKSFFVWVLILPAMVISFFMERRNWRQKLIRTHIDKINDMVWLGFFISYVVFTASIVLLVFKLDVINKLDIRHIYMLNIPIIITLLGMGQFITACVLRHKLWYIIAASTWIGAILSAIVNLEGQFIIFAACMFFGFAVPGHIMNYKAKKSNV